MLHTENTPAVLLRYLNNFVLTERKEGKEGRERQTNGGKKEEKGKIKSSKYLGGT